MLINCDQPLNTHQSALEKNMLQWRNMKSLYQPCNYSIYEERKMDSTVKYGLKENSTLKVRFVRKLCIQHTWSLVSTYWQIKKECPSTKRENSLWVCMNINIRIVKKTMQPKLDWSHFHILAYYCSLQQCMPLLSLSTQSSHPVIFTNIYSLQRQSHKSHLTFKNNQ